MNGWPVLIVAGVVALVPLVWSILTFNRLVATRQHLRDSWAGVEVELKRRYDLIPNLVETVKGYAGHERRVLERVIELRGKALANHGSPAAQAQDENQLIGGLRQLAAVAEAHPDLRADRHFLALQQEMGNTEDRIAAARRFYNGNVRDLNTLCEMFPSNLVAGQMNIRPAEYFEIDDSSQRAAPVV